MAHTQIDTTTPESWAETWLVRFTELMDDPSGTVYAERGGDFDLVADMWAGDLPWREPLSSQVLAIIKADSRFPRIAELSDRVNREHGIHETTAEVLRSLGY